MDKPKDIMLHEKSQAEREILHEVSKMLNS